MATFKFALIPSLLLAVSLVPAAAASGPSFGEPVITPSAACHVKDTLITHSPDSTVLSVLRNQGMFVENIKGSRAMAHAHCRIDFVFKQPLEAATTLQVDMRGTEFKGPQAESSYTIRLGAQRHHLNHARGEILDGEQLFRRFQLVSLPAGTRQVRLDMKGQARSLNHSDPAQILIDSFDLCFVDSSKPTACGAAAPAAPAPASK